MSQKTVLRLKLQTTLKIALVASLIGLVAAVATKEKYILIISIINLVLSVYLANVLR